MSPGHAGVHGSGRNKGAAKRLVRKAGGWFKWSTVLKAEASGILIHLFVETQFPHKENVNKNSTTFIVLGVLKTNKP